VMGSLSTSTPSQSNNTASNFNTGIPSQKRYQFRSCWPSWNAG
jgi:hypothetical protein